IRMKQLTKKYYRADASYLSQEVLEEIIQSRGKIKNAAKTMANKYNTSTRRIYALYSELPY
ncbi:6829_t:CDS:1, partial [Diversispora eburnea]